MSVLADALEHLVRGIVDHPDEVRVDLVTTRRGRTLEVRVHPDDLGKVIGRGGRTATALRTVVNGIGGRGVRWMSSTPTGLRVLARSWWASSCARTAARGELVVEVHTDSPEERFAPGAVLVRQLPTARRWAC